MDIDVLGEEELTVDDLLRTMVERGSSDLHIKVGSAPMIRVDGELTPAAYEIMTPDVVRRMCESILTDEQKAKFIAEKELDLAYSIPGVSRFRVNIYLQRGSWGAAMRVIPSRPLTLEELKMPPIIGELAMKPRGLVLVTGPTGSGKSTTLAAMINHINENRRCHIVTCEDPIEFLHKDKNSVISQREVGADTHSFAMALKHVPGIGSGYARRIVSYRQRLGGFCRVEQLLEIEGFPESALPYFELGGANLRKLDINRLTLQQLKEHPYVGYRRAKAIADYRRLHGPLQSLQQLRLLDEFSAHDIQRLEPYIQY